MRTRFCRLRRQQRTWTEKFANLAPLPLGGPYIGNRDWRMIAGQFELVCHLYESTGKIPFLLEVHPELVISIYCEVGCVE